MSQTVSTYQKQKAVKPKIENIIPDYPKRLLDLERQARADGTKRHFEHFRFYNDINP